VNPAPLTSRLTEISLSWQLLIRQQNPSKARDTTTGTTLPYYTRDNYTPVRNIGRVVLDLSNELQAALNREVTPLGITGAQWVVLMRITSGVRCSAADLCRDMGYDSGSMTRMLDRLEKHGLIERCRSVEDRRVVELSLTPAGEALYPQLAPVALKVLNHFIQGFTADEVEGLISLLERMLANGQKPPSE